MTTLFDDQYSENRNSLTMTQKAPLVVDVGKTSTRLRAVRGDTTLVLSSGQLETDNLYRFTSCEESLAHSYCFRGLCTCVGGSYHEMAWQLKFLKVEILQLVRSAVRPRLLLSSRCQPIQTARYWTERSAWQNVCWAHESTFASFKRVHLGKMCSWKDVFSYKSVTFEQTPPRFSTPGCRANSHKVL